MTAARVDNRRHTSVKAGWIGYLRTIAREKKINVVFGHAPKTDGRTVYLPNLPLDLTSDDAMIVRGDAHHEIGHIVHSDVPYFMEFASRNGAFAKGILNAIEDPWMEVRSAGLSRMAETYLRKSVELAYKRGKFNLGDGTADEALVAYVLCFYFSVLVGWSEYDEPMVKSRSNFVDSFGEGAETVLSTVEGILRNEARGCNSTEDNALLTLRIIDALKELDEEDQDQGQDPSQGSKTPENEPSDGTNEGDCSGNDQGDANQQGSGSADENQNAASGQGPKSQNQKRNGNTSNTGADSGQGNVQKPEAEGDSTEPSLAEKIEEMLKGQNLDGKEVVDLRDIVGQICEDEKYDGAVRVPDGEITDSRGGKAAGQGNTTLGITPAQANLDLYRSCVSHLDSKVGVMAAKLQQVLEAKAEEEVVIGSRGRRVAGSKLFRLPQGNGRVFKRTIEHFEALPAISMLCDLSDSTADGSTDLLIQQSAYLLASSLDRLGVNHEVIGFGSNQPTLLTEIKSFDASLANSKARFGGMKDAVGGGTPMLQATFEAVMRLASQEEERKQLFVLTDGDPWNKPETAKHALRLQEEGVELVYLLVGKCVSHSWLEKAGLKFVCVPEVEELPSVVLNELKALLV